MLSRYEACKPLRRQQHIAYATQTALRVLGMLSRGGKETHTTPEIRPVPVHLLGFASLLVLSDRSCTVFVLPSLGITRSNSRLLPAINQWAFAAGP